MPSAPPMLRILADTDEPRSIRSLAERSQGQYAAFYKAAQVLHDEGLLRLERDGRELLASAASTKVPGLARDLLGRKNIVGIFRGERPMLLHVLHRGGRTDVTAEVMGKTPRAIRSAVHSLAEAGILVRDARGHRIDSHHRSLIELVAELDRLRAGHRLQAIAPRARLVWHLGPDLLFQTPDAPVEGTQFAGLDAFSQYGITIQTRAARTYYHGNRTLTAADALLQALLVAGYKTPSAGSLESPVQVGPEFGYACLLWEKEDLRDIWVKADLYDLHHAATDVVKYVHEKSDEWAGFPPWSEHNRLRRLYGVGQ